jgi:predicted CoA-binding protein
MGKKSVIIGASDNPERYSFKATSMLKQKGHQVYPVGIRAGKIDKEDILLGKPQLPDIDTVTLYVGPKNQPEWFDYVLSLHPKRLIFNPGTENPEFVKLAEKQGIECVEACTLVMLSIGNY